MGTLTFVRHGQARPFEKESDQLSAVGEQQARALGQYWARRGVTFDEVYSGLLVRQVCTAGIVGQCLAEAGLPWPHAQALPEFNEYDANGITGSLIPALAERDEEYRALFAAYEANRHMPDRNRHFQKMFEVVVSAWQGGELEMDGVESWSAFRQRVRSGLKQIIAAPGSGRRVAVFTSGGVIGTTVQTVLEAPESQALAINWRVKNCSLTEFTFGGGRISMDSFNTIPHLEDRELVTFR
ncbi:MAG TPA: histidine phosphatase family protein [Blastocatellia bacterium]